MNSSGVGGHYSGHYTWSEPSILPLFLGVGLFLPHAAALPGFAAPIGYHWPSGCILLCVPWTAIIGKPHCLSWAVHPTAEASQLNATGLPASNTDGRDCRLPLGSLLPHGTPADTQETMKPNSMLLSLYS